MSNTADCIKACSQVFQNSSEEGERLECTKSCGEETPIDRINACSEAFPSSGEGDERLECIKGSEHRMKSKSARVWGSTIASGFDVGTGPLRGESEEGSDIESRVMRINMIPFQMIFGTPIQSERTGIGLGLLVSPEFGGKRPSYTADHRSLVMRLRAGVSAGIGDPSIGAFWPNINLYGLVEKGADGVAYGWGIDFFTNSFILPGFYMEWTDNPTTGEHIAVGGLRGAWLLLWN